MSKKKPQVPEVINGDKNAAPDRLELFARNVALGMEPKVAARDAGYSEGTIQSSIYQTMRRDRFQTLLRNYILQHNILQLPKYLQLDEIAIDAALRKADTSDDAAIAVAGKMQQAAKRKFSMAGLLRDDDKDRTPTISIDSVQNLMLQIGSNPDKR